MLRVLYFFVILISQYELHEATPLVGQRVGIANYGEYPFIVSISKNFPENIETPEDNHLCGGTLITREHVLTNAHCVINRQTSDIVAKVGSIDLRNAETFEIKWMLTYSSWANITDPLAFNPDIIHDIAVVKLDSAVSLDIKLPILDYKDAKLLYGGLAKTAGWGRLEDFKISRYLRIAKRFIMYPDKCEVFKSIPDALLKELEPKALLCTAETAAKMTCGDSGSPLLSKGYHLVGINKAFCFLSDPSENVSIVLSEFQNLHTFVNFYQDFIETMKQL